MKLLIVKRRPNLELFLFFILTFVVIEIHLFCILNKKIFRMCNMSLNNILSMLTLKSGVQGESQLSRDDPIWNYFSFLS